MAKPVSEEELQLKKRARRRLIGAIALVAAVAAMLPMVLDSEPKPTSQEINIEIPAPPPKGSVVSKAVPAPLRSDAPASAKAAATAPEKSAPARAEVKAAVKAPPTSFDADRKAVAPVSDNPNDIALSRSARTTPEPAPIVKAPEKAAVKAPEKVPAKTASTTAAAAKAGPGSFFIQVIALSEAYKAKQVQQRISGAGIRAYTEVVDSSAGQVTRVRAGPFATREEADKAQATLQGIGLEGKVAAY